MDPHFTLPTEPPRRKSKVSLSQLLAHIRSTDQREGIQGFIFNSPAPSVASSRNSSFSRRRSSCMMSDNRRSSNRSILLVTSESDSDYECRSALTASSIGSFTRKGSGTPSHLRCIIEVDGEKPTLTADCNRALSLPNHTRQRRPPPLGLRCAVGVSRDPSLLMLDTWTFSSAEGQSDIRTPSSVDSFKCKGMPFDEHVESTILLPLEKAPKKPPMSAPATDRAAVFRTAMSAGPPPANGATRPRQSSVGETEKKPRLLPLPPTRMATYPPSNKSQNPQPFDAPPNYSLVDPSLEVQYVKASRRRGGLFSPLPGGNHTQQMVKQSSPPHFDVQTLPPDENGPPRTVRQKIKSGIASMHGKSNSQESAPRKPFGDASSRNNSLEGGQPRKGSLPKTLRKKSTGSRKKSLPSAWFDDDEYTDESGDEQLGVTLIVPAGIQQHKRAPLSTRTLTTNPFFDPNFSFSRRCQPRLSVSEAPAPRRYY